ncbi:DUF1657 domain-containing protein [Bacillus chungangensis]|uniref:DUF1657 domain-containing protein n=1 Tax=Bacillus chungangensis TaxID=587633 RepID=A0ABT9WVV9_9BACI|nr:DUF1657 domain-containing protein [Bacillus chungangensis]MDQ0177445.1 hypothetical protein [Bacillus chungangensis]
MTVYSNVKTSYANLKSIQASFSELALKTTVDNEQRLFHESMIEMDEIIEDIRKRLMTLEREERQYQP